MSQAKVEKYKEEKANRKKLMRQEKLKKIARNVIAALVVCGLVGWIGYSVYNIHEDNKPRESVEVDYSAVDSYLNTLQE